MIDSVVRKQFLCFSLAGTGYGLGILRVKEILQYESVTRVPCVPRSVRGVINLRGAVVPVIDLAVRFDLPDTPITARTCVLIVETTVDGKAAVIGVIADEVREVLELGPDDVLDAPELGHDVRVPFIAGMGKVGRDFVLILDVDVLLSLDERRAALAAAGEAAFASPAPETEGTEGQDAPNDPGGPSARAAELAVPTEAAPASG